MRDVVGRAKVCGGEHPGVSLELGGVWTRYSALLAVPDSLTHCRLSAIRVASDVSGDVSEGVSMSVSTWDTFWDVGMRHRVVDHGWGFSMRAGCMQ